MVTRRLLTAGQTKNTNIYHVYSTVFILRVQLITDHHPKPRLAPTPVLRPRRVQNYSVLQ